MYPYLYAFSPTSVSTKKNYLMFWVDVQKLCGQLLSLSQVHFYIFRIHLDNKNMREKIRYAYEYQNKLASLEATLVRNIDRLTHSLTGP